MSKVRYGVSWIEWKEPLGPDETPDPKAEKVRKQAHFDTEGQREEFLDEQVDRDDFLYVLSKWEERVLL